MDIFTRMARAKKVVFFGTHLIWHTLWKDTSRTTASPPRGLLKRGRQSQKGLCKSSGCSSATRPAINKQQLRRWSGFPLFGMGSPFSLPSAGSSSSAGIPMGRTAPTQDTPGRGPLNSHSVFGLVDSRLALKLYGSWSHPHPRLLLRTFRSSDFCVRFSLFGLSLRNASCLPPSWVRTSFGN